MDTWPKIIAHADMDAFYAAVEQLDDPALRGKPVLVGPRSHRGVVLTASYEARPYGVGSAMAVAEARRRCPGAVMVPPRFERYEEISKQVMNVFGYFSPDVEPLSLDEAFLDMSGSQHIFGPPGIMGRKIKDAVREATQLNISVGISSTKYVAKVASAHDKPNGLTVVPPHLAVEWLAPMPVNRLWGVGKKTMLKLHNLGLMTIGEIAAADERELRIRLGGAGSHFYQLAHAMDPRRVKRGRTAKSIGSDRTLSKDVSRRADIELHLRRTAERIARRMRAKHYVAGGIRVRLKTATFEMLSRQIRLPKPDDTAAAFFAAAKTLLDGFNHPGPFRLVGLAAFDLDWRQQPLQSDLFEDHQRDLETAIDHLIDRFGKGVVMRAKDLGHAGTISDQGVNLDFLDYRDGERVSTPGT
ncbi:MAG: DNA polymerase IV [Pseudomonadales bacterium]